MEWKGVFEPLRDPTYFAKVKVDSEAATVVWPNGADLAPETLYQEARKNPLIAAPIIDSTPSPSCPRINSRRARGWDFEALPRF
jgi:hypothetical protein